MAKATVSSIPELSTEQKQAGAACLQLIDKHGFNAQGAAWIYSKVLGEWRYYLVTILVEIDGPRATYDRIQRLFKLDFNNSSLMIDDVHLGSPKEELFLRMAGNIIEGHHFNSTIINHGDPNVTFIEEGFIYRMDALPSNKLVETQMKKFDQHIRKLEKAMM